MNRKLLRVLAAFAAAFLLLVLVLTGCKPPVEEELVPRSYQCDVYTEQGCAKFVIASGGELEVQSGGIVDIQSGAGMTLGGNLEVDGNLGVDGNISSGTGCVTVTDCFNATGAGDFDTTLNVDGDTGLQGHLSVAKNVTVTLNLDVDGATTLDGLDVDEAATFNNTVDIDGNITSGTGAVTVADAFQVTGDADFDGSVTVDGDFHVTGHQWITASTVITGDTTIAGHLSVSQNITTAGNLDVDGTLTSATGAVTVSDSLNVTGAADFDSTLNVDSTSSFVGEADFTDNIDLHGYLYSSTGSDYVHINDNTTVTGSLGVTVDFDVDGATTLDGLDVDEAATFNNTVDIDGNLTSGTGAITVADTLNVTGAADFDSTVNVDGVLSWVTGIVSQSSDYQLLVSQSGSLVTQPGATGAGQAFTLPVAATGLHYCFYVHASTILTITPEASDQIHHLTNAAGDRINNAASAGDSICLMAIDTVNWIPLKEVGTWSDTD